MPQNGAICDHAGQLARPLVGIVGCLFLCRFALINWGYSCRPPRFYRPIKWAKWTPAALICTGLGGFCNYSGKRGAGLPMPRPAARSATFAPESGRRPTAPAAAATIREFQDAIKKGCTAAKGMQSVLHCLQSGAGLMQSDFARPAKYLQSDIAPIKRCKRSPVGHYRGWTPAPIWAATLIILRVLWSV